MMIRLLFLAIQYRYRREAPECFDGATALAGINLCIEEYSAIYAMRDNAVL